VGSDMLGRWPVPARRQGTASTPAYSPSALRAEGFSARWASVRRLAPGRCASREGCGEKRPWFSFSIVFAGRPPRLEGPPLAGLWAAERQHRAPRKEDDDDGLLAYPRPRGCLGAIVHRSLKRSVKGGGGTPTSLSRSPVKAPTNSRTKNRSRLTNSAPALMPQGFPATEPAHTRWANFNAGSPFCGSPRCRSLPAMRLQVLP
jgi:hypothetical protein